MNTILAGFRLQDCLAAVLLGINDARTYLGLLRLSISRPPFRAAPGIDRMNQNFRNFALWAVILLLLVALFNLFQNPTGQTGAQEITYSQFRTTPMTGG